MIILGIETTAHTFGVGIVNDQGKVLANAFDSFTCNQGGMILDEVAEHHKKVAEKILTKAFAEAKLSWKDVDLMAYSAGPGLDPVLYTGYHLAQAWSEKQNKKLVGVNHCAAHLSIGKVINQLKDPCYLYVSGVNTQVIVDENNKYRVVGETLDLGLGNMLDKLGRSLGLGFPAGPEMEQLAKQGKYLELPYTVKGMDVSLSGMLTKVQQLIEKGIKKEDLCFSVQETCFAMLTEVTERAMANANKKELLLVGGVGANQRFCEMLKIMCKERGAKFYKVPMDLARDNGAMIAWEGYLRKETQAEVNPHWRVDEV
ncbi:MAG: tRNA (adenosine(37)-N6)-threonylcarbamoyltransferase complex transferase subunit TsaD [Nanoarchaeota archaeon]|nr:tRNA (adenosine(37)-N6)-threonylcarbamoyltransferase complex transferase subunit TsaD [Nanoarchaeota archaeon]MBU1622734.1 tRNA (adenosine(37)-N6)-threonylcarbamoyltransferase complex transferase subunit TsaD [Nanoarchaeota archaeon]MBU1974096.1 tRNA (adenosine(37)-N6)-threonylcarbamoyltransferase complex transferase subunit TsaD [Nanoarchaeota archaeon]